MARTGGNSTAKPFRVLLPASPEALVAAKYNLDISKGAPSFLMGRRGPDDKQGGTRPPVSGNPGFRNAAERPQSVFVPRPLVRLMARGPGSGGDYDYGGYVGEVADGLEDIIIDGMGCRFMGRDNIRQPVEAPGGRLLQDARGRTVRPPYFIAHSVLKLAGPFGSAASILLRLNMRVFWAHGGGRLMLHWRAEDTNGTAPWARDTGRLPHGAAQGRFALLDRAAGIDDVALLLVGVYQAVDLCQTRTAMAMESIRRPALPA